LQFRTIFIVSKYENVTEIAKKVVTTLEISDADFGFRARFVRAFDGRAFPGEHRAISGEPKAEKLTPTTEIPAGKIIDAVRLEYTVARDGKPFVFEQLSRDTMILYAKLDFRFHDACAHRPFSASAFLIRQLRHRSEEASFACGGITLPQPAHTRTGSFDTAAS
jgi:hypothetical protein